MPCTYLNSLHRGSIHAARELHGYVACKGFDCFGAGQWITQSLFGGATWTDTPGLARQMFDAYRRWAPRSEAAALLEAALPHIRAQARFSIIERMKALTSVATVGESVPTDARQLRRETIATIQSALRADAVADYEKKSPGSDRLSSPQPSRISRIRRPNVSMGKGLVNKCIPASRYPWPKTAFSA
jgi:hypothetical protein